MAEDGESSLGYYEGKHDQYDADKLLDGEYKKYDDASEAALRRERRSQVDLLSKAVEHGDLDKVREYVRMGTEIQHRNEDGTFNLTALHTAAYHGHLDICRFLVKECSAVVDAADQAGLTPLHRAAYNGKVNVIRYLVDEARANIWLQDGSGLTPCQMAEKFNQDVAAEQLLQYAVVFPPPNGFVISSGSVGANSKTFMKANGLVGCRVQVYQKPKGAGFFGSKKWCDGLVLRYDEFKVKHYVHFDDGTKVWIHFNFQQKDTFRVLMPAPAPRAGAMAHAVAAPVAVAAAAPMATVVSCDEKPSAPVVQGYAVGGGSEAGPS